VLNIIKESLRANVAPTLSSKQCKHNLFRECSLVLKEEITKQPLDEEDSIEDREVESKSKKAKASKESGQFLNF